MAKKYLPFILVGIVLIIVAFYGGMKVGQSTNNNRRIGANFPNLTPEQQQMAQRFGGNGNFANRIANNNANGEIIAKDEQSITVKLRDGGSKIIFFSDSTQISKSTTGIIDDLAVGTNVMVSGTANQDGSLTAQDIRLVPQPVNNNPAATPPINQPAS